MSYIWKEERKIMLSDYDRQVFNDTVAELESDDPEFVARFRARKTTPSRPQRSRIFHLCTAIVVFVGALGILLVPMGNLAGAVLPALAVIGCASYLYKFRHGPQISEFGDLDPPVKDLPSQDSRRE